MYFGVKANENLYDKLKLFIQNTKDHLFSQLNHRLLFIFICLTEGSGLKGTSVFAAIT